MEERELSYLLRHPSDITPEHTGTLKDLLEEYPFFQAARAVRLKGLKNQNSLHYNKELKVTAAYTIDRSVLFDFITSEEFNQNEIADRIKQQQQDQKEGDANRIEENIRESASINEALRQKAREPEPGDTPEEKVTEEKLRKDLKLGAPFNFKKEESHSFSEWLKLTKAEPVNREKTDKGDKAGKTRKFELIDQFISKSPKIKPGKTSRITNLAEENTVAPEALMTETLAKVYLEQKNYKKAIQAYKILILKNPEKSGSFADQIRAIQKLQEHNS